MYGLRQTEKKKPSQISAYVLQKMKETEKHIGIKVDKADIMYLLTMLKDRQLKMQVK